MPEDLVFKLLRKGISHLVGSSAGLSMEEVKRKYNLTEIIKLASNENPLGPSPAALSAMHRVLPKLHLYPDGNAFYLKNALAARLQVTPGHVVLGNGSNEVLELVGHALLAAGDDVVVAQYCFAVYPIVTHLFGANLISVPAKDHGHDLPAMLRAVTPRTKVVFVANPNNPTGTLASRTDVLQLVNDLPPQVLLVLDEAYLEYLDDPVDLLPFVRRGQRPNLFLTRTFSKIYGLAGLRLGYGIGHPDVIAALEKVREPFNINSVAQAAALAALDDAEHIDRTRANNHHGLVFLQQAFKDLGLEYLPSAANFILVKVGDGQRVFIELQKLGVIVRPMGGYQLPGWVRITVGTPPENERCVRALKKVSS